MSNIDKLVVENFKAFYGSNTIDLDGKNLLIYGENGSGKSSIYWALYTLLQSTTKTEEDIAKYFDRANEENLLNINSIVDEALVKISASDEPDVFHKISRNGYELDGVSARQYSYLEALNASSDFISHRLLINFFNFRNSKEINLWEVFVRDIFPFITTVNNGVTVTLAQLYKDIIETLPFYNFIAAGGRNIFKVRQSNHNQRKNCLRKINLLNDTVNAELANINGLVNNFYVNNFKEDGDDNIEISLEYATRMFFGDIFQTERRGLINYIFPSKRYVTLNNPFIKLKIRKQKEDLTWIDITRPQSYFNEALLTQIALSIRFALTQQRMGSFEGQFLALDDLLVSLDMSNRDKVLEIILNVFAPNYKIYLFTHERSFFNMAKARIESEHNKKEWSFKELYGIDEDHDNPQINNSDDFLTKSIFQYKQKDYPASVNYLRKELEKVLNDNLPGKVKKGDNGEDKSTLDSIITSAIIYLEKLDINPLPLKKCQQYLQILLNPLSHNEEDVDAYETDIKRIRKVIEELKPFLIDVKKRTKEIFPRLRKISLTITENDTITQQKYTLQLQEELYLISEIGGNIRLSECKINSLESRTYIENVLQDKDNYKNEHWKSNSLFELYAAICTKKEIEINQNCFEYFKTLEGVNISEFF
jgi:energy-coupling factor transporter ATP-binding protein EcfA2